MCTEYIYRHIRRMPPTTIITTRELLQYGRRGAVDQATYRMVKIGFLVRLARGVFVRDDSLRPSKQEIAEAKLTAFGKKLLKYGEELLQEMKLSVSESKIDSIFATNGPSSSFETIRGRVYLKSIGQRKVRLCDTDVGRVVYALWHLGEKRCTRADVRIASRDFRRTDREEFQFASALMPAWLNELCLFRYPAPRVS